MSDRAATKNGRTRGARSAKPGKSSRGAASTGKAPAPRRGKLAPRSKAAAVALHSKSAPMLAPPAPPAVTTKAFWPLMDRWAVPDDQALRLLGHAGGLTSTGKRPRFTLTEEEARRLTYLNEVGTSLELMFGEAGAWLRQRTSALPFRGASPLEYMIDRGPAGIAEVLRFLARFGLSQALRS